MKAKTTHDSIVNGIHDMNKVANLFANHFKITSCPNSPQTNLKLQSQFMGSFQNNMGNIITTGDLFDVEQITKIICFMKLGKSPGNDDITTEHLIHGHYFTHLVLTYLLNLMIISGYVRKQYGVGVKHPIPIITGHNRLLDVSDYRGITLSPVISKILEKCISQNYEEYFLTSDRQFGFKKHLSCSYAIPNVKSTDDYYSSNDSNVFLCLLDISKAFDKVNKFALHQKLFDRILSNLIHLFISGTLFLPPLYVGEVFRPNSMNLNLVWDNRVMLSVPCSGWRNSWTKVWFVLSGSPTSIPNRLQQSRLQQGFPFPISRWNVTCTWLKSNSISSANNLESHSLLTVR